MKVSKAMIQANRENARKPRPNGRKPRLRINADSLPCTCGECPHNPKRSCQRGKLLYFRQRRQNLKSE